MPAQAWAQFLSDSKAASRFSLASRQYSATASIRLCHPHPPLQPPPRSPAAPQTAVPARPGGRARVA